MPSPGHEITVVLLERDPWLLSALAGKLIGKAFPGALKRDDSTVRFGAAREVRPDLIFTIADCGRWVALEVQLRRDPGKAYSWPVLVGTLLNEHKRMGDLVVLTSSRRVAEWARSACDVVGLLDTEHRMVPILLWVSDDKVDELLDRENPRLAYFSAWAMRNRNGPRARQVVEEALRITKMMPDPLRGSQVRAILGVVNRQLRLILEENIMAIDASKLPELPEWYPQLERVLMAELKGQRAALFTVFKARGLKPTPQERKEIRKCPTVGMLERWITRAVSATSVEEVLALDRGPLPCRKPGAAAAQAP